MESVELVSLAAGAIGRAVPFVLLIAAIATLTGNFAAKRFFDRCGLRLRPRYWTAAGLGAAGLVLFAGFGRQHASTILIATLLILALLAWRAGSRRQSAVLTVLATALLAVVITARGGA